MKWKFLALIMIVGSSVQLDAQNLVYNGSFEIVAENAIQSCFGGPNQIINPDWGTLSTAKDDWLMVYQGPNVLSNGSTNFFCHVVVGDDPFPTADLLDSILLQEGCVEGFSSLGIELGSKCIANSFSRTYLEGVLIKPLIKDEEYYAECVLTPHRPRFAQPESYFNIRFSDQSLLNEQLSNESLSDCKFFDLPVHIIGSADSPNFGNGKLISGCFSASGGEEFIQFGNFQPILSSNEISDGAVFVDVMYLTRISDISFVEDTVYCFSDNISLNPDRIRGLYPIVGGDTLDNTVKLPLGNYTVEYYLEKCGYVGERELSVVDTCIHCDIREFNFIDTTICPGETIDLHVPYDDLFLRIENMEIIEFSGEIGTYDIEYVLENCGEVGFGTIEVLDCPNCFKAPDVIQFCVEETVVLSDYFNRNLIFEINGLISQEAYSTQEQSVSVTVYTDACDEIATFTIEYEKCTDCNVFVPDAFSPNNDGINDIFFPFFECGELSTLTIYDQWGARIFESNPNEVSWNGAFRNRQVAEGTYVYLLEYFDSKNADTRRLLQKTGTIQCIR